MEFQMIPSFPVLFMLFSFMYFLAVVNIAKRSQTRKSGLNLPPGPWKLPLIGNMCHFMESLPHHSLRDLAKTYGPIMHLKLGQLSTLVISSPEAAKEVMKTHDAIFAYRPFLLAADILAYGSIGIGFSSHGDYWRQLRKICITELLSPKRVQSFRSIREEEMLSFVRLISSNAGSMVNFSRQIFAFTFSVTSRTVFGKKCKYQEEFLSCVNEAMKLAGGFSLADVFPSLKFLQSISGIRSRLEKIHQTLDRILESIIDEHKSSQVISETGENEIEKDLVGVLLNLQENGNLKFPLANDNIKATVLDIFVGGIETSSITVEWAMSEMLKNPRVMEKAQAEVRNVFSIKGDVDEAGLHELKYLKVVIKETLRLHPPGPLLVPRECRKSCEIFGYDIPAMTKVIINAWAIGRDSRHWSEAERFYPERFLSSSIDYKGSNFEYIPFGAGRRICPGMSYGIANVELPLAQLLYHFDWNLPNGAKLVELDMTEGFGVTVRRKNDLYLIPSTFHPSTME